MPSRALPKMSKEENMSLKNFLEHTIPNDFDATLVCAQGNKALYAKLLRHVWHFIYATIEIEEENYYNINTSQVCIPRFLLAEAVHSLVPFNQIGREPGNDDAVSTGLSNEIKLASTGNDQYELYYFSTPMELSGWVLDLINEDLVAYEKSKEKIRTRDNLFYLPRSKTYTNKSVECSYKRLVQAVAFERELHHKLDEKSFGVYSAFCTWKDFTEGVDKPNGFYEDLVSDQLSYDPNNGNYGEFMDVALKVQDTLFSERFWAPKVASNKEKAVSELRHGMRMLSSFQRAQFALMNGMHSAGLFLPLAQILGLNSWDTYCDWITSNFSYSVTDKGYRQILSDIAIIKLLGDLSTDA